MFTQLQYAGSGWFVRKTFQGVNVVEKINFRRGQMLDRKLMGYSEEDLNRVQSPDHSLHMVSYYTNRCVAEMKAGNKAAEDKYTDVILAYTDACVGQITRRIEQ